MSARLELDDLPPRYRAQAEAQIAARQRGKCTHTQPMAEAASAAGRLNKTFDSYGEYVYYIGTILPGIQSARLCQQNRTRSGRCCKRKNTVQ